MARSDLLGLYDDGDTNYKKVADLLQLSKEDLECAGLRLRDRHACGSIVRALSKSSRIETSITLRPPTFRHPNSRVFYFTLALFPFPFPS
jgi:hypothetical protein